MVYQFGAGVLIAKPTAGDLATNPTPLQFGTLQEASLEIAGEVKELYGRNQSPDDVARAKIKYSLKAKYARFNGKLVNDIFFGQTISVGMLRIALDELQSVPANPGPWTVTVTHAANFKEDYGVRYAATGKPLTRVNAGSEAAGKYSVNETTGVYTFVTADQTVGMLFTYEWNDATNGFTTVVANQLMGFGPRFEARLFNKYNAKETGVKLYRCIASKLTRATKIDDYNVPDFEAGCMADDAGNVMAFYDEE